MLTPTRLVCPKHQTLGGKKFDAVFDMNAREVGDTQPLADLFADKVDHYVFMSSAGVYLKSDQVREFARMRLTSPFCARSL